MAITLKSGISSNLDVLYATKLSFRGIGLNVVVLIALNSEWWRRKMTIGDGVAAVSLTPTLSSK
ncbi:hypothetical protein ACP8HI_20990 [Paenibacillus sp. FA6]|uniref:hypothetical protein n=1 Tax=Paenibacillus sp. FA6 TaxID=3413029 RepID=UPI003F65F80E